MLVAEGVSVWFSEKDIVLGQPFLREIDRGVAKSRTGIVLVTPAPLKRVGSPGVSDKQLHTHRQDGWICLVACASGRSILAPCR